MICEALSAYILALLIGGSSLLEPLRERVKSTLPCLQIGNNKHFIECRLCLSFWTSLLSVSCFSHNLYHLLPVYGLAYFLATQER